MKSKKGSILLNVHIVIQQTFSRVCRIFIELRYNFRIKIISPFVEHIYSRIFCRQVEIYIIHPRNAYRCLYLSTFFFGAFTLQTPGIEVVARIYSKLCVIPLLESSRKPWPSIEPSLSFGSVRGIPSLSLDNRTRPNFKGIKRFESLQFLDPRESSEECTCGAFVRCFRAARCIWHACRRYTVTFNSGTPLGLHFELFLNRSKQQAYR